MKTFRIILITILSVVLATSLLCLVGCETEGDGSADGSVISGTVDSTGFSDSTSASDPTSVSDSSGASDPTSVSDSTGASFSDGDSSAIPDQSSGSEAENTVKVTFEFGNGAQSVFLEGNSGDPLIMPEDPVRDGYKFNGWDKLLSEFPITDTVVTAKWMQVFSLTVVYGNGTPDAVFEGTISDPVPVEIFTDEPARDGYKFAGWEIDGASVTLLLTFPSSDSTLTATWSRIVKVTFNPANGDQNTVVEGAAGDVIMAPVDPERSGSSFGGWALNGEIFNLFIFPENDITLTAVWNNSVTVHFDTGTSDVLISNQTVNYGETIAAPEVSRSGYLLRRWTYLGSAFDFETPVTRDITLTAEWLERTNLPTMSIELFNENGSTFNITSITRETYVTSSITLCDAEGNLELDNYLSQTKGRGNGSWSEAGGGRGKCGLKIKLDKKQSLFGRAKNKHWVLLGCVNFDDVTMCRNYTAYNMAGEIFDGMEYVTNVVWVDLFVNGEYRGVYDLCEHVRVAEGRVDIDSEYGVPDTGYLIEYDAYASGINGVDYFSINSSSGGGQGGGNPWGGGGGNPWGGGGSGSSGNLVRYNFTMHSPSPEDYETEGKITQEQYREQVSFIQDYVRRTYASMITDHNFTTFASLADVDSFVDMYILQELYKNTDAGYSSFYLYKKPSGKLFAGPAWDFDGTTTAARGSGQATGIFVADPNDRNTYTKNELLIDLYANADFRALVVERWKVLSPQLKTYYSNFFNDAFYTTYGDAMAKNFYRWRSNSSGGGGGWSFPGGGGSSSGGNSTLESAKTTWINNTRTLATWFNDRINYLDGQWR